MVTASPKDAGPGGLSEKVKRRVDRAFETLPFLPDDALVDIWIVCAMKGRSKASVWRDVAAGRLPTPVKLGGSTRWCLGAVRAA